MWAITNSSIHAGVAQTYLEVGTNALQNGNVRLAQRMLRAAVKQSEQLIDREAFIAPVLANLAEIHYQQGQYLKARVLYKRALSAYVAELGENNLQVALLLCRLAELAVFCRNYTESREFEDRAISSYGCAPERTSRRSHQKFSQQILLLANAHFSHNRADHTTRLIHIMASMIPLDS